MSDFQYLGDRITYADVAARVAELESEREDLVAADEPVTDIDAELKALREFAEEIPADEALIADEAFEDYARDLADELHGRETQQWPFTCIDWEQAARELRMDYTSYEYDDTTYWGRA